MWVNTCIEGSNPSFSALPRKVRPRHGASIATFRGYAFGVSRVCAAPARSVAAAEAIGWAPRRGGRAVECGGLENRYPSLGGSRVQIPPPPLEQSPALAAEEEAVAALVAAGQP